MGVPNPALRHLIASTTPNPHLLFTPDDVLLHTTHARIQRTDVQHGRTQTLPHEATRNLTSLSLARSRLLTTDEASRAILFNLPATMPSARLTLRFRVLTAALSPCAQYAAFAGDRVEIWRVPTSPIPQFAAWDNLAQFAPGNTSTATITWSSDSRRLAVGLSSGVVMVYTFDHTKEREEGVHIKPLILHGHRAPVTTVRFIGSRGFLSLSEDGVLLCWRLRFNDLQEGYTPQEYPHVKNDPARNPKRRMFAVPLSAKLSSRHFVKQSGARRARCADVANGMLVTGLSNGVFALYELPPSMRDEDEEYDQGLFDLGKLRKGKKEQDAKLMGNNDGEKKPDSDILDEEIPVIPFTDLTVLHTLSASAGAIARIAFSATGDWVALAAAHSGQIVVWDWRAETHVLKQQAHTLSARTAAFSPDGRALATGADDGRVKLWGVHTGFCAATFTEHAAAVTAVTFAANDVIVSASLDGTVRAFDIRRYRNFRIMVAPPPRRQFSCVAVDAPGELVAAGCVDTFEVLVWSLRTGRVLEVLDGHRGPVSSLAFRPHRGTLASASWDRSVRLWDMYERKGACEVLEHSKEVLSVAFRPDGREFASCTMNGEIVFWNPESGAVAGTVDGARDAAAGRTRESRTIAPEKGYFQTLSYSADGRFLYAGAASKHVCIYHVAEGSRPSLVRKLAVTQNQNFDGLLNKLNSKLLTDSGHALQEVDDEDEGAEDFGESKLAQRKSLPGAASEEQTRRKMLMKAQVHCVNACATGRLWSAVTSEGVLLFGDGASEEFGDEVFDPTNLDIEVTPDAARKTADAGDYKSALLLALRLNMRECLNDVVDRIPVDQIDLAVRDIPVVYFARVVALLAWRLDNTPHLEVNLRWAKQLMLAHGAKSHGSVTDPATINTALRALNRACMAHSKRLKPVADGNESMLKYLLKMASRQRDIKEDEDESAMVTQ